MYAWAFLDLALVSSFDIGLGFHLEPVLGQVLYVFCKVVCGGPGLFYKRGYMYSNMRHAVGVCHSLHTCIFSL